MNIGIIGSGGAGTCAAWLLDERHNVTVFEKRNYLGGSTHTVRVNLNGVEHLVDDGAAWFSPTIYPYMNAYMELTGVAYDMAKMSCTYHNLLTGNSTCLPPADWYTIFKIFLEPHVLPELLALNKMLNASMQLVHDRDSTITYKQFMDGLGVSTQIKETFLKPLFTGLWGAPFHEPDGFAIYSMVKYMTRQKPPMLRHYQMKTMRGGCENYIGTVCKQLRNTNFKLNTPVVSIAPAANGGVTVTTADGKQFEFDHVITTGGAYDTKAFLKNSDGFDEAVKVLSGFRYYKALLATHSDLALMPPNRKDWSLVNVSGNREKSFSTIWAGRKTNTDLFCSYIAEGETPKNLYHVSEWWLPIETPDFFETQKLLEAVQGKNNVWFAGDYTHDIGSHEDAIVSAVKAVEQIDPGSGRLNVLKQKATGA